MGVEQQAQKKIGELAEDNAKLRQELADALVVIQEQERLIKRMLADSKARAHEQNAES